MIYVTEVYTTYDTDTARDLRDYGIPIPPCSIRSRISELRRRP